MQTTLRKIRKMQPCTRGWNKLLRYLGKAEADDATLSLLTILESNGLSDALWALCAVEGYAREIRLYAVECARDVQHLMTDPRSLAALDVAEQFANGDATEMELTAARADAYAAHASAAYALAASKDTHRVAWDAASAAYAATYDSASEAAYDAASRAAAAYDAAARAAAARAATRAATRAAAAATRAAARAKQEKAFRKLIKEKQ